VGKFSVVDQRNNDVIMTMILAGGGKFINRSSRLLYPAGKCGGRALAAEHLCFPAEAGAAAGAAAARELVARELVIEPINFDSQLVVAKKTL
jgi:hypothetical protein